MGNKLNLRGDAAALALAHLDLVPPARPPQFSAGATAELRDAMARFSGPGDHETRRAAVDALVATIDLGDVTRIATSVMRERLGQPAVDVVAASWVVPSYVLAIVLGHRDRRERIRADTEAIVRVIGRNEASGDASDAAAVRLLDIFSEFESPVAAVSIMYQNHDATSGLIRSTVHEAFAEASPTCEGSTVRVAIKASTIAGVPLAVDDDVRIDLTNMRFGSGPHRCPGEALASAVAAGVVSALRSADYRFDPAEIMLDEAGFPSRFVMCAAK